MRTAEYDVIVVGARCGGSPTAMLLARKGYHVLLVDKTTFPRDTMSTHLIHPPGVAALARWDLLERLLDTACPPIHEYSFDFGPFTITAPLRPSDGIAFALCPRRTVLDNLLVESAVDAGAELREGFIVDEVLTEGDTVTGIRGRTGGARRTHTVRARVVVGADGMRSLVARSVDAPRYHERPALSAGHYAYWSGLPTERFEGYIRPRRAFAFAPTHDGLTMGVLAWSVPDFEADRTAVEEQFMRAVALVPELADRMRSARRETRFVGTADLPNFFRRPYGPGWMLVGDAGYHKDPITAQGISDAFRSAEMATDALGDALTGRVTFEDAMADYQRARDEAVLPMFDLTCRFANLEEPPPAEMQQLLAAIHGNSSAMQDYISTLAGVVSPSAFFDPDNIARIMADAAAGRKLHSLSSAD